VPLIALGNPVLTEKGFSSIYRLILMNAIFAGGHGTFSNLINNLVHVIMYFYYMMTAMGPQYQKYIWWKKHLTTIQLVRNKV